LEASALGSLIAACPVWKRIEKSGLTIILSQHYFLSTVGVRVSGSYSVENHTLGERSG